MVDGSSSDKHRERESSNSSQQGETWSPACLMVLVSVGPVAEEGMSRATNHSTWMIDPKMKEMRCIATTNQLVNNKIVTDITNSDA